MECPEWLDSDCLLSQFAKRRSTAIERYQAFVEQGKEVSSPLDDVRHQLALGDDTFVETAVELADPDSLCDVSRAQRRPMAKPLSHYLNSFDDPKQGTALAYQTGAYTMREIGEVFGVHEVTVGRAIRMWEN